MNKNLKKWLAFCALAVLLLSSTHPVSAQGQSNSNQFWWPDQLDLSPLRQHAVSSNPLGGDFDYGKASPRSTSRR